MCFYFNTTLRIGKKEKASYPKQCNLLVNKMRKHSDEIACYRKGNICTPMVASPLGVVLNAFPSTPILPSVPLILRSTP